MFFVRDSLWNFTEQLFLRISYFQITSQCRLSIRISHSWKHCVKSVRIWSFSGPYFCAFGLNTKRYSVSLRTHISPYSAWEQENTDQKNSKYGHFSLSVDRKNLDNTIQRSSTVWCLTWIKEKVAKVFLFEILTLDYYCREGFQRS